MPYFLFKKYLQKSYSVYRGENQILHTYCGSTLPPISYFPDSDVNHMEDKLIFYRTGNSPKHRRGFKFEYSVVGKCFFYSPSLNKIL
jgi:hypothetical protein